MGKFKNVGNPSLALMEEMAEAIQVIAKKHRFEGDWDEIPEGKELSRWQELCSEMEDVIYQWNRVVMERYHKEHSGEQFPNYLWAVMAHMNTNKPTEDDFMYDNDEPLFPDNEDYESYDGNFHSEYDEEMPIDTRSENPQYIVASTSYATYGRETYVFEADENGMITSYSEYGGIAERFGDEDWQDRNAAVQRVFPFLYKHVKEIILEKDGVYHSLYERIGNSLEDN